jgi:hypothetical protein
MQQQRMQVQHCAGLALVASARLALLLLLQLLLWVMVVVKLGVCWLVLRVLLLALLATG